YGAADYQLKATSLSKRSGTDGKDLGVDFAEMTAALNAAPTPIPDAGSSSSDAVTKPFSGTPSALPGKLEFENYDKGGSGVAYHDTTNGNSGNVYRSDSVDIQATSDAGGGYHLAW